MFLGMSDRRNMENRTEPNFIPGYCFLTGQFLIHFERNKQKDHYKEVHINFLESTISDPRLTDFYYPNPGVILMLCYGLIVYPLEFWKKQTTINYEVLEKQIVDDAHDLDMAQVNYMSDLFENIRSDKSDIASFMRSLRNAVSNSHVELSLKQDKFILWDVDQKTGKKYFEVSISIMNLAVFLTGVGKFFINSMKSK